MLKLAVYGDSYADVNVRETCDSQRLGKPGYPGIVAEHLGVWDTEHCAFRGGSGTSMWWSYKNFIEDIEQHGHIESVIFCYTSFQRIPFVRYPYCGSTWMLPEHIKPEEIEECDVDESHKLKQFVELYYDFMYEPRLLSFICENVFRSVQEICQQRSIKLINVLPFTPTVDYSDSYGPCVVGVDRVSYVESGSIENYSNLQSHPNPWKHSVIDPRCCHLTGVNNEILASKILDLWDAPSSTVYDFYQSRDWSSDADYWHLYSNVSWNDQHQGDDL